MLARIVGPDDQDIDQKTVLNKSELFDFVQGWDISFTRVDAAFAWEDATYHEIGECMLTGYDLVVEPEVTPEQMWAH